MTKYKGGKTLKQPKPSLNQSLSNPYVNNTIRRNRRANIEQSEREILEHYGKLKNINFNINHYQRTLAQPTNQERLVGELATEEEMERHELEWIEAQIADYERRQELKNEKKRKKKEKRKKMLKTIKNTVTMKPLRKRMKNITKKIKNKSKKIKNRFTKRKK